MAYARPAPVPFQGVGGANKSGPVFSSANLVFGLPPTSSVRAAAAATFEGSPFALERTARRGRGDLPGRVASQLLKRTVESLRGSQAGGRPALTRAWSMSQISIECHCQPSRRAAPTVAPFDAVRFAQSNASEQQLELCRSPWLDSVPFAVRRCCCFSARPYESPRSGLDTRSCLCMT